MSELMVARGSDGVLVVDSRLVAQELGIEHESFMKTVEKYKTQAEQAFGGLRFEIGVPDKPTGNPPRFVLLTEEHATFYMTLSRNTPEVVQLKLKLVQAFSEAKRLLRGLGVVESQTTSVYIQRLQNMSDHIIADDVWSTFKEGAETLLMVEMKFRVPVSQLDLCDGSIGSHWSQYREEIALTTTVKSYIHNFKDQRGERECKAYVYDDLPIFKKWLRELYIPTHLPEYLVGKYGKRAVLQIYEEQKQLTNYILGITEIKRVAPKEEEKYSIFLAARDAIANRYLLDG